MDLIKIRHRLHQLAEPSGEEFKTKEYILEILKTLSPAHIHTFDDSSNIVAEYDFGPGPTLLFRGDFDAVRVDEILDIPYSSLTAGVSHKCGHDGHATILLGLAEQLHLHPLKKGRILLFFQAAEETGKGAEALLQSGLLENYTIDQVFALHNIPGESLGSVICKADSFTCSVISCDIHLNGKTSHAAEPLKAISPYLPAVQITNDILALNHYDIHHDDFCLLTLVEFKVGEQAYGVTAGNGVLRFTLRSKHDELLQQTKQKLISIVNQYISPINGLSSSIEWKEYFAASRNHQNAVDCIRQAAGQLNLPYIEKETPFSWGEDFGLLTQHYNGVLFGLGSGEQQASLHHPYFNFPDELLPVGVKLFYAVAENAMEETIYKNL